MIKIGENLIRIWIELILYNRLYYYLDCMSGMVYMIGIGYLEVIKCVVLILFLNNICNIIFIYW